MKEQEIYTRQMPFNESPEEIDALVSRVTDKAINEASSRRHRAARRRTWWSAAAAVAVVAIVAAVVLLRPASTQRESLAINDVTTIVDSGQKQQPIEAGVTDDAALDDALLDVSILDTEVSTDVPTEVTAGQGPIDDFIASCDDAMLEQYEDNLYI